MAQSLEKTVAIAQQLANQYDVSELTFALAIKEAERSNAKLHFNKISSKVLCGEKVASANGAQETNGYVEWVKAHLDEILRAPYASASTLDTYQQYLLDGCIPYDLSELIGVSCVLKLVLYRTESESLHVWHEFVFVIDIDPLMVALGDNHKKFNELPFGIQVSSTRRVLRANLDGLRRDDVVDRYYADTAEDVQAGESVPDVPDGNEQEGSDVDYMPDCPREDLAVDYTSTDCPPNVVTSRLF